MLNLGKLAATSLGLAVAALAGILPAQDPGASFSQSGSWPAAGNGGLFSQQRQSFRTWHSDYKEKAAVTRKRNDAWPKPFICQDRMNYFLTMALMYDSGWIAQCCLTDVHFDAKTGELNQAGQNKVQSIMNNNPLDRRNVFIVHNLNVLDTQARLENVQSAVSKWYGPELASHVTVTDRIPMEVSGQRIERVNTQYQSSIPVPALQTSSGSNSGAAPAAGGN